MTRSCAMALVLCAFSLLAPVSVFAQAAAPRPYRPPSSSSGIGIRAYGIFDVNSIAAKDTFDAVFGTAQLTAPGAGVEATGLWKGVFARFTATTMSDEGSRVFVNNGTAFDLGIPLTLKMTPIEAGGGWRFALKGRLTPYVGASFVSVAYEETSKFAESGENVSERYSGAAIFGGADFRIYKWIVAGGEVQFRSITVPESSSGVMREFGERDLGGLTGRVVIGVHFK